ncbi:DUF6461 domain-containing protein [Streptomyces sp. NPDC005408]|uniref:DUF6461 domain-containing protein n=1 Tax=Streptomyces sp. NPDC005408 TaxID=3155341 RepID=UPI0033B34D68
MNDGLQWLPTVYQLGFCVTFVRDIGIDDMIRRMGGDPSTSLLMTLSQAEQAELRDSEPGAVLRFGTSGAWSYAAESWGAHGGSGAVLARVSEGTEAVSFSRNERGQKSFSWAESGMLKCTFDPDAPEIRGGADPDALLEALHNVGLLPENEDAASTAAMLTIAEQVFGLGLVRDEVASSELRSVRFP